MKRDAIRAEVNGTMKALGIGEHQFKWFGPECLIVLGGKFRTLKLKAGTSRLALARELGRLEGWCEMRKEMA